MEYYWATFLNESIATVQTLIKECKDVEFKQRKDISRERGGGSTGGV